MDIVKCPKCNHNTYIDLSKACDEYGESFMCDNCKFIFRYIPDWE
jgi:uncharacterized protein YbaR (Trm112 family)